MFACWKITVGVTETVFEARNVAVCVIARPLTLLESPKQVLFDNGETLHIESCAADPPTLGGSYCKQAFSFPFTLTETSRVWSAEGEGELLFPLAEFLFCF